MTKQYTAAGSFTKLTQSFQLCMHGMRTLRLCAQVRWQLSQPLTWHPARQPPCPSRAWSSHPRPWRRLPKQAQQTVPEQVHRPPALRAAPEPHNRGGLTQSSSSPTSCLLTSEPRTHTPFIGPIAAPSALLGLSHHEVMYTATAPSLCVQLGLGPALGTVLCCDVEIPATVLTHLRDLFPALHQSQCRLMTRMGNLCIPQSVLANSWLIRQLQALACRSGPDSEHSKEHAERKMAPSPEWAREQAATQSMLSRPRSHTKRGCCAKAVLRNVQERF